MLKEKQLFDSIMLSNFHESEMRTAICCHRNNSGDESGFKEKFILSKLLFRAGLFHYGVTRTLDRTSANLHM